MQAVAKKKRKRAEGDATGSAAAIPACFAADALARAPEEAASFAAASPFAHAHLSSVFEPSALLAVRKELSLLQSTFKETDLFKVYQTGDLANLDAANPEHAAALPSTIALRAALYSPISCSKIARLQFSRSFSSPWSSVMRASGQARHSETGRSEKTMMRRGAA